MTLPFERTRAVVQTKEFLQQLTDPSKTPRVPKQIRQQAHYLLRHYPCNHDLDMCQRGWDDSLLMECPFAPLSEWTA
jgi:hypothetical protein